MIENTDILIVGAGIVGLAHAYEAQRRGLSVRIIERDHSPNGASIRNFGHACITAQAGDLLPVAFQSRQGWLAAAKDAGFWASEAGGLVVARSEIEIQVLEELKEQRSAEAVEMLTAEQVHHHLGDSNTVDNRIVGGAYLPADLRVDPRRAAPQLAQWLEQQPLVEVEWCTAVGNIDDGVVSTSQGVFKADRILVCVGHDLDYLYPDVAHQYEVTRCALQMALAAPVEGLRLGPAILSGTSMDRYDAFTTMPGHQALLNELKETTPDLVEMGANVMFTQRPDGTLLLGDSHVYNQTMPPFQEEWMTQRLVDEISIILGQELEVTQRWQGIYASSPQTSLLIKDVDQWTRCISVTSGIGMTLSFGIAAETINEFASGNHQVEHIGYNHSGQSVSELP